MIAAAVLSAAVFSGAECHAPGYTREFDRHFRAAVMLYWPAEHQDWCWLKAQGIVESALITSAVSPAGAQCLMQIMPGTHDDLVRRTGMVGNIFEARYCVMMGALYMSAMFDFFILARPPECERELSQAAYNAGPGHIDKAWALSGGQRCWPAIAPHLRRVTGRHSEETIQYVERINAVRGRMRD